MAWSAWQDAPLVRMSTTRLVLGWSTQSGPTVENNPNNTEILAQVNQATGSVLRSGWQHTIQAGWETYRRWFPNELRALTEGVDYDVIPGKDPNTDDDAYVEYETSDPNVMQGWVFQDYTVNRATVENPGESASWETGWTAGTTYAVGDTLPWPGVGTMFGTFTQADAGLNLGQPLGVGLPESVSIIGNTVAYSGTGIADSSVIGGNPGVDVWLPRWRYWIPDTVVAYPLRQKQRNDGLARGVFRARSTSSIQNSVRQNSYR